MLMLHRSAARRKFENLAAPRTHIHALLGGVALKPKDGVLWAHPDPNAKGLTEVSPLHIEVVAGGVAANAIKRWSQPWIFSRAVHARRGRLAALPGVVGESMTTAIRTVR